MDETTKKLANFIRLKGIALTRISIETGIPYSTLHNSMKYERPLRADEFLKICEFVGIDPMAL